ncbi:hypothetical protein D0B32_03425 [Paraburkholderia sp. DHOC27]|nr:hypothetical protein D0B32_03425 [Paraburkholderia sp. DHOC27]
MSPEITAFFRRSCDAAYLAADVAAQLGRYRLDAAVLADAMTTIRLHDKRQCAQCDITHAK